jgi:glycosyltransferase involved in cell wall biosynthesis
MRHLSVSVCITTYNHEKYIAKALDSVLMQEGDFSMEVLVGEDGSTDGTAAIVLDYAQRYPDKIRAFFHDPADKLIINGRQTGRKNFINNLVSAQGKYIALLDGDDYWTDEHKLEKQLAFLEGNQSFVACCHSAIHVDENDAVQEGYTGHHDVKEGYRNFTIYDVLQRNPVPSLSVLFRNSHVKALPDYFYKADMADWSLHIFNSLRGDVHYVDEKMAAYRLHNAGLWAGFRVNREKVLLSEISVWSLLLQEPDFAAYAVYIKSLIEKQYGKLVKISLRNHAYSAAWHYWQCQKPQSLALALRIARKQLMHMLMPAKAKKS